MIPLILQLIVLAIVVAFVYWAYTLLIGHVPVPAPFAGILNTLIQILLVAVIVFYAVIPLVNAIGHAIPVR